MRCSSAATPRRCRELRLHNGTVYRWNRPVYEVVRGRPHVRVENRVLPAGPTVVDILANAAFYYGLVRMLVESERPIWSQMSFSAAEDNLHAGARDGLDARVYWPGVGDVPVTELVLRRLLPLAHEGLERYGVDPHARDRLLGIIERRCVEEANGATWQSRTFRRLYEERGLDRDEALRQMTVRYRDHMHAQRAGAHLAGRADARRGPPCAAVDVRRRAVAPLAGVSRRRGGGAIASGSRGGAAVRRSDDAAAHGRWAQRAPRRPSATRAQVRRRRGARNARARRRGPAARASPTAPEEVPAR